MGCCSSAEERQEIPSFERAEPLLEFDCKVFDFGGVQVARCAVQGWRKTMEDMSLVQLGVSPREDMVALGVFDGHSGAEAAQFAQEKLLGHIKATDGWRRGDLADGCVSGFVGADAAMRKSGVKSGTTAVLAFLTADEILVANCGDSRSVLSRGGRQLPMSVDHKPGRKTERRRILRSGGYLDETDPLHPRVVCDTLKMSIATSRALGDFDFKSNFSREPEEQMISPIPEFYTRQRVPEDEYLVLATDGVWDVMDNPEIVSFLTMQRDQAAALRLRNGPPNDPSTARFASVEALARAVLQRCLDLGSRDNMTIVLADLRPPKPPDPRAPAPTPAPAPAAGSDGSQPSRAPEASERLLAVAGAGDGRTLSFPDRGCESAVPGVYAAEATVLVSTVKPQAQCSPEEACRAGGDVGVDEGHPPAAGESTPAKAVAGSGVVGSAEEELVAAAIIGWSADAQPRRGGSDGIGLAAGSSVAVERGGEKGNAANGAEGEVYERVGGAGGVLRPPEGVGGVHGGA